MKVPAARSLSRVVLVGVMTLAPFASRPPVSAEEAAPAAKQDEPQKPAAAPAAAANKTECDHYLPVLTGKKKGSAMLADPQLRAIAKVSADLVMCGAVAADSDELCGLLEFEAAECRTARAALHELRTNPKGHGFIMSDDDYENCSKELPKQSMPASFCDEFRAAARAGDPAKCPKAKIDGALGWCTAIVTLDKSKCVAVGKIEDKEQGKAACEKIIDRYASFAKGLDELAKSGTPRERALAKAAKGQADACKEFEADAMKACAASQGPPAAPAAPTPNQAPAAPAPGATPPKAS